jgi:uncharacterized repeat protein (TIGR02543 family)
MMRKMGALFISFSIIVMIFSSFTLTVAAESTASGITVTTQGELNCILAGESIQMIATFQAAENTELAVSWTVIDKAGTAEISAAGLLTGTQPGLVTVHAEASDNTTIFGELDIIVSTPFGGVGTAQDPYLIGSADQLALLAMYVNVGYLGFRDKCYRQSSDIDLSSVGSWTAIGNNSNTFAGLYDGNGFEICNFTLVKTYPFVAGSILYASLFGNNSGTITNIVLNNVYLDITSYDGLRYIAAVAGYNTGTISYCTQNGSIIGHGYVGGIVGFNQGGKIICCGNLGPMVRAKSGGAGGIVDVNFLGEVSQCYNFAQVVGSDAGGIVNSNQSSSISNCFNAGPALAYNYATCHVGGIAAFSDGSSEITRCYNLGTVSSNYLRNYGCILGFDLTNETQISSCYYYDRGDPGVGNRTNLLEGSSLDDLKNTDTFVGFDFDSIWAINASSDYPFPTLQACVFMLPAENTSDYGGGRGLVFDPFIVGTKSHLNNIRLNLGAYYILVADLIFTDDDFSIGGTFYNNGKKWLPIGINNVAFAGSFDGCGHIIANLQISSNSTYSKVQRYGLFEINGGIIFDLGLINTSIEVLNPSRSYIGSIAGETYRGTISNCFNTGDLSGFGVEDCIGGICGSSNYSQINGCFNTGNITGVGDKACVGGIAGAIDYYVNGEIQNCYNTGTIKSQYWAAGISADARGIVSMCYNIGAVTGKMAGGICLSPVEYCYYLSGTSAEDQTANDRTIAEMKLETTYAGYDFSDIWVINPNSVYPFPTLREVPMIDLGDENYSDYSGGRGTAYDPFRIATSQQLDNVRKKPGACFVLLNDIVFDADEFKAGGPFYNDGKCWQPIGNAEMPFFGYFYGNGHTIYNLTITDAVADGDKGCYGLFGLSAGYICDLNLAASLINVTGSGVTYVGNLVGYLGTETPYFGISGCSSSGQVAGMTYVGGIAGYSNGVIHDCNNIAIVSGQDYVGGIVGYGSEDIRNCQNHADISAQINAGGIAGYGSGYIYNCKNNAAVSSQNNVGGIAGQSEYIITSVHNSGAILGSGANSNAGGIAGFGNASIGFAVNTGKVTNTAPAGNTGGIIGQIIGSLWRNSNQGDVTGVFRTGGLAGYCPSYHLDINNCYNTGNLAGQEYVGGIIGLTDAPNSNITCCYNTGSIASARWSGGIAGQTSLTDTVASCYFLNNISQGVGTISGKGISITQDQLQLQSTFSGFDFSLFWIMPDFRPYEPILRNIQLPAEKIVLTDADIVLGTTQNILSVFPVNASLPEFSWLVETPAIIDVDLYGNATGLDCGTTALSMVDEHGNILAACNITVGQIVSSIDVLGPEHLIRDQSVQMLVNVLPEHVITNEVIWSVTPGTGSASISTSGVLTGLMAGTVTVTATAVDGSGVIGTKIVTIDEIQFTVRFEVNGGSSINSIVVMYNDVISAPIIPIKTGYTFVSWYKDMALTDDWNFTSDTVQNDMTLFARWTINKFIVSFNSQGGTSVLPWTINYSSTVPEPVSPTRAGYVFVGWYTSADCTTPWLFASNRVIASTILYARWLKTPVAGLTVQSAGYNSIKLTWTSSSDANGYEIWCSNSSSGTYSLITVITGGSTASYINANLTTNMLYYYKIKAFATIGVSKVYSNESSVASGRPIPGMPISFAAASASYNSVRLTWAAVSGASGYQIYRATSYSGTYSLITTLSSAAISYTNSSLTTGRTYYYKIRAYRLVGTTHVYGNYTSILSTIPIPATPSSFKSVSASYSSVRLSWVVVSGASGYLVYRASSSSGTYSLIRTITSGSTASYTHTGLTTNTTYYYKIRAYRLMGTNRIYGNYSLAASAKPVPSVPGYFSAAQYSQGSIRTSWSLVSGANGYEVWRATSSTGVYSLIKTTTSTSYVNTGLVAGQYYYYKVRAYRLVGTIKVFGGYSIIKYARP